MHTLAVAGGSVCAYTRQFNAAINSLFDSATTFVLFFHGLITNATDFWGLSEVGLFKLEPEFNAYLTTPTVIAETISFNLTAFTLGPFSRISPN